MMTPRCSLQPIRHGRSRYDNANADLHKCDNVDLFHLFALK